MKSWKILLSRAIYDQDHEQFTCTCTACGSPKHSKDLSITVHVRPPMQCDFQPSLHLCHDYQALLHSAKILITPWVHCGKFCQLQKRNVETFLPPPVTASLLPLPHLFPPPAGKEEDDLCQFPPVLCLVPV